MPRSRRQLCRKLALIAVVAACFLGVGCRSTNSDSFLNKQIPRIHAIGTSNILVFEKEHPLSIPVTGAYFADETLIWSISVTSVAPLEDGKDYRIEHEKGFYHGSADDLSGSSEKSNVLRIVLQPEYVARVSTGDTLNIEVSIADGTEQFALGRIKDRMAEIETKLKELTAELNKPQSDPLAIHAIVTDLLKVLHENNDEIAKLKSNLTTTHELTLFTDDVDAIQEFMVKRKTIPENLRDEVPDGEERVPPPESGDTVEPPKPRPEPHDTASRRVSPIKSWRELERRLQAIAARQRGMVSRRKENPVRAPVLSSATRQFTLYETQDYRVKVLSTRVPVHDISAYPLPRSETLKLFGEYVAEMYFVVRLSIRNTTEQDRLISTGLIKAYGRALVGRNGSSDGTGAVFTVPVEVVPQSREHVYTIVADGRMHSPRNILFRGLEFTGALGSALIAAFDPTTQSLQWASLFGGVLVPQAEKLWPDEISMQLGNIVNFSMPDLIKVPRNAVVGHKYLFFSKGDLQAMISDTEYARQAADAKEGEGPVVVYMAFDSLHIPFENTIRPGLKDEETLAMQKDFEKELEHQKELSLLQTKSLETQVATTKQALEQTSKQLDAAREQVVELTRQLDETRKLEAEQERKRQATQKLELDQIDELLAAAEATSGTLNGILTTWCNPNTPKLYPGWRLTPDEFKEKEKAVRDALKRKTYQGSSLPAFEKNKELILDTLKQWQHVLDALQPVDVRTRLTERLDALKAEAAAVEAAKDAIKADLATELDDKKEAQLRKTIEAIEAELAYYGQIARTVRDLRLQDAVSAVLDADVRDLDAEIRVLLEPLRQLSKLRGKLDILAPLRPPVNNP